MANSETTQSSPYSLLNIGIISVCLAAMGYGVYYYQTSFNINDDSTLLDKTKKPIPLTVAPENKQVIVTPAVESTTPVANTETDDNQNEKVIVEEDVVKQPLLDESDPYVLSSIEKFSQLTLLSSETIHQDIIRNSVVFIDNFSRGEVIARFSPIEFTNTPFTVARQNGELYIAQNSYQRYDIYTNFFTSIDTDVFIEQYEILKPLIANAFAEISRPDADFDNTLNDAIELIIATPIITEPIKVNSPSVAYTYADPELEALNGAQKLMLRMGPDNLIKIKKTLKRIQERL